MFNNLKLIVCNYFGMSSRERLGENIGLFISGIEYINFSRIRIMSLAALIVFFPLWIWDIIQFSHGKWDQSVGYQIVTYFHTFLLVFLTGVQLFCKKKQPENPDAVKKYHTLFIHWGLAVVLFCTLFLTLGDVLTSGSIAAYLGIIFAYASIFIMPNMFAIILFGANLIIIVTFLSLVYFFAGRPMDIQIINAISFTLVAFVLSRILFFYNLKDFQNRMVIERQTLEISQQVKEKEKLIDELKKTLDDVTALSGLLPICANCKKIRDDKGYWNQLESYLQKYSKAKFSHGLCPECSDKFYGKKEWYIKMKKKKGYS